MRDMFESYMNRRFRASCLIFTIVIGSLSIFPLGCVGCYTLSNYEVSQGYRDGTVRKLSHSGTIWKTYECEMLGDGMRTTNVNGHTALSPETFQYSILDEATYLKVGNIKPGKKVRVHYKKYLTSWPTKGETMYFIYNVEEID